MDGNQPVELAGYAQFLFDNPLTKEYMGLYLYITIVILAIIVYKLGFARKLPILKSAIIYVLMLIGCIIMAILALQLPIVGALFVATIVLTIYKVRLTRSRKKEDVGKEVS